MALTSGTRLGPYEIQSPLGQGGMGEVYKARDTRLDRTVAIKVLPEALASDPTFRERFDREAKAIAALQHPHICTLYDVGQERQRPAGGASRRDAEGDASGGAAVAPAALGRATPKLAGYQGERRRGVPASPEEVGIHYLVLEYLDGQTLAERLTRGALPIEQALTYAIQIADALDKAHRAGIVHRDLKPGNVMVTKGGVKLLDFGLAKTHPGGSGPVGALSALPTVEGLTAHGTILGTFHYMAPEQLEGKDADARTDIFAFGAVVYEMVTGKKTFEGKSQASLIGAIMSSEPTPLAQHQPMSPPALDRVVKKCLRKNPEDRWQSARDVTEELRWVTEGGSLMSMSGPVGAARGRFSNVRVAWAVAAVAAVALLALSMPAVEHLRETTAVAPEMRLEIRTPFTADPASIALSPDGQQIVFVASDDGQKRLWLRRLDMTDARPLAETDGATSPFWSPDSRSVGFFADGQLKRLDLHGGSPQTLAAAAGNISSGTWSQAGVILFGSTLGTTFFRVPASGGNPTAVTTPGLQEARPLHPFFLPDGNRYLFYAQGTAEATGVYLGALDLPETTRLTRADTAGLYLSSGWVLWIRDGSLVAQRLDVERRALVGDLVSVATHVAFSSSLRPAVSVSATGMVAYRSDASVKRQLTWVDRFGTVVGALGPPDESLQSPRLSPDGRWVTVGRTVQGNIDVWLLDGARSNRFTFGPGPDQFGVWSPDGRRIVFGSFRSGSWALYVKASSNAGDEEKVLESPDPVYSLDWSPDGRFLLYQSQNGQSLQDLWVFPFDGHGPPWAFLKTPFQERNASFSPDGRWVSYMSDESGSYEVYVRPFAAPGELKAGGLDRMPSDRTTEQYQISTRGGTYARWRADGKELYYLGPDGKMMAVPVAASGTSFVAGTPVALFPTRILEFGGAAESPRQFDVASDGRFLINTVLDDKGAPITLILNWQPPALK